MDSLVASYLAYLENELGRSANTIASYRRDLNRAVDFFNRQGDHDWADVDQYAILNLVAALRQAGRSSATINRQLSVLRQFYRYLVRHQVVRFNPMDLIDNEQHTAGQRPVILTVAEINRLLSAPQPGDLGQRDHTLIALLAATGMRVSEAVELDMADVHLDVKMLRLGHHTKNERLVPISDEALADLDKYMTGVRPRLATKGTPALFVNARGQRLTRQGVWKNLKSDVKRAGIHKPVTPRTIRYSFAVRLLRSGADSRLVQEMLGYSEMRALKPYLTMTVQEMSSNYEQHQPWR